MVTINNIIYVLGFIAIFTFSIPMQFFPISLCQVSIVLLFIIGGVKYRFKVNKYILILITYCIFISIINYDIPVTLSRIDAFIRFVLCLLGCSYFVKSLNGNYLKFIRTYIFICAIFSIISIIQEVAFFGGIEVIYNQSYYIGHNSNVAKSGLFLQAPSLTQEPQHFGLLLIPSLYALLSDFYLKTNYFTNIKLKILIIIGFILTFSFTTYAIFFLMNFGFILINFKRKFKTVILALISLSIVFVPLMRSESNVTKKFNSMFVDSSKLQESDNLSSFAIISNALIAFESAKNNIVGTGFYTNEYNYNRYISKFFLMRNDSLALNATDGGSMYIKIISEYGFLGVLLFFFLLVYLYKMKFNKRNPIRNLAFWCLILSYLRMALYNSALLWTFFAILASPQINTKIIFNRQNKKYSFNK